MDGLLTVYPGWTLTELKSLSPRERYLWLARAARKVKR